MDDQALVYHVMYQETFETQIKHNENALQVMDSVGLGNVVFDTIVRSGEDKAVQHAINVATGKNIDVDGVFGSGTWRVFQDMMQSPKQVDAFKKALFKRG